jgi:Zn-finger nucleic acid-binding protein
MTAETLNCPNCGAGVASDSTVCKFCQTRLKTVACPKCLGLMFFGSKFCGHCGEKVVAAEANQANDLGNCPRCGIGLQRLEIGKISLSECERCSGLWSDAETFESICLDRDQQTAALAYFGGHTDVEPAKIPIRYVPCPHCKQLMNRSNFAHSSGVIVDLCKEHGVWFDPGELPKIVDFIENGGLARAREKEKIALDEERQKIREERRQLELDEMRSAAFPGRASGFEIGGSEFFKALFDL